MNVEEAKNELTRLKSSRFLLRFGILCGISMTVAFLGISFIRPYHDFIFTASIWPLIGVSIYLLYLTSKLNKIEKILQTSEETQEVET